MTTAKTLVLIETYWNVNVIGYAGYFKLINGLNRNILECKFPSRLTLSCQSLSLNRNILECKLEQDGTQTGLQRVLIETYWNVNIVRLFRVYPATPS